MAFNWSSLIDIAREWTQEAPESANAEALYRSSLSRLYFGAFGHAREYATSYLNFVPHDAAEDHGRLRTHLRSKRRHGDPERLEQLRDWRNLADYASELPALLDLPDLVAKALTYADRILLSLAPPKKGT
jgi:hypothetical protein